MKLLLRRSQKSTGMMRTSIAFQLDVRAELSPEELEQIERYKFGDEVLYSRDKAPPPEQGLMRTLAFAMTNLTVKVNDLAKGKSISCKDIGEMMTVEEQIKEAAGNLKAMLHVASTFGGEEVIEL